MAKKKFSLNFTYDSPVSLSFVILSVLILVLDLTVLKLKLNQSILLSPTSSAGAFPFAFSDVKSIFRLFLYIFGGTDKTVFLTNCLLIILMGPEMEERYGSIIIGIMIFVAAFFAGVLNACFCKNPMSGCNSVVFMFILLDTILTFSKKRIKATSIAIIALFICREVFIGNVNGAVGVMITIAGGLCGSLFAFLASPRARSERKGGLLIKAEKFTKKSSSKSHSEPKSKPQSSASSSSSDETVVGTLKF